MKILADLVLFSVLGYLGWLLIRKPTDLRDRCTSCGEPLDDDCTLSLGDGRRFCCMLCLPTVMRPGRSQ